MQSFKYFLLIFFIALLNLANIGCVGVSKYRSYSDDNNIYHFANKENVTESITSSEGDKASSAKLKSEAQESGFEMAIRSEDGKLVKTKAEADDYISKSKYEYKLYSQLEEIRCGQDTFYKANLAQKRALELIKEKDFAQAQISLRDASNACEHIGWFSLQYYLEALVAQHLGDKSLVDSKIQKFLEYTESSEAPEYYGKFYANIKPSQEYKSFISMQEVELRFYRDQAQQYLQTTQNEKNSNVPELKLSESDNSKNKIAKMYSNNIFRPGSSINNESAFLPIIGFSSIIGGIFGLELYKSWGENSIVPVFMYTGRTGNYYGLTYRRSLLETETRDLNINFILYTNTLKEILVFNRL